MIRVIFSLTVFAALILLLTTCDNYEFPTAPYTRLETLEVTNISSTGVTFRAKIISGDAPVISHGFVWDTGDNPLLTNADRIELGSLSKASGFEAEVSSSLNPGEQYQVKAFVRTDNYIIYGNVVSFVAKGSTSPSITSFSPATGTWGDVITIKGKNFSTVVKNNLVKFGELPSKVLVASDSLIECEVPENISDPSVRISVAVAGNTTSASTDFVLATPAITGFTPQAATFGDIITINGSNFSSVESQNTVKFNEHPAEVIEASPVELKVRVPSAIRVKDNTITVTVRLRTSPGSTIFSVLPPVMSSVAPEKAFIGGTVQITGSNFNPDIAGNVVTFDQREAVILAATNSLLTVAVPSGIYDKRSFKLQVMVAGQSSFSAGNFTLQNAWLKKTPMEPFGERTHLAAFGINGKGYIGMGVVNGVFVKTFYEYDPVTSSWETIGDFPGPIRSSPFSFVIGDYAYVGGGYDPYTIAILHDFWKFDPASRSWTRMADLPMTVMWNAIALSAGDKGYLLRYDDIENFWSYAPGTDEWTSLPDFSTDEEHRSGGFAIGQQLFFYTFNHSSDPNHLNKFDIATKTWTVVTEVEDRSFETDAIGFALNGAGYLIGTPRVNKYNPQANSWQIVASGPWPGSTPPFIINGKAYLWSASSFWEFDPAYEK